MNYKDGDEVVVLARIKHTYEDGRVDLELADGRILFAIYPDEVRLYSEKV